MKTKRRPRKDPEPETVVCRGDELLLVLGKCRRCGMNPTPVQTGPDQWTITLCGGGENMVLLEGDEVHFFNTFSEGISGGYRW